MIFQNRELIASDGHEVKVCDWRPSQGAGTKAVVQILHGLGEHAIRYDRFANACVAQNLAVVAHDHRGHGKQEGYGHFADSGGVSIWDGWADENGELGPVYGVQWRHWPTADGRTIDQISGIMQQLRETPDSRRILLSAWNVAEIENMVLPPCHCLFQFYVADGKLSCQLYQRSCDIFLGVSVISNKKSLRALVKNVLLIDIVCVLSNTSLLSSV